MKHAVKYSLWIIITPKWKRLSKEKVRFGTERNYGSATISRKVDQGEFVSRLKGISYGSSPVSKKRLSNESLFQETKELWKYTNLKRLLKQISFVLRRKGIVGVHLLNKSLSKIKVRFKTEWNYGSTPMSKRMIMAIKQSNQEGLIGVQPLYNRL